MADNKIRLPSSSAGVTSFSEEYKSKFMLSPIHVMILIGVVVAFVVLLHAIN